MDFTYKIKNDQFSCRMEIKSESLVDESTVIITEWLSTDGPLVSNLVLEELSKALNNNIYEHMCISGNAYDCDINKGYSIISFQFEDSFPKGECLLKPCKVPNKLLYEIVETWQKEYEKWKKRRDDFLKKNPNYRPPVIGKLEDFFPKKNK